MPRYQIKIVDGSLADVLDGMAAQALDRASAAAGLDLRSPELHDEVFFACKAALGACVRGFHVCGCMDHCDEESRATTLSKESTVADEVARIGRSRRVRRYILSLDVRLGDFVKDLQVRIVRAIAERATVRDWGGTLGPAIQQVVEASLGPHLFFSPACNRGEYICTVGTCTEFDPWEEIRPRRSATPAPEG